MARHSPVYLVTPTRHPTYTVLYLFLLTDVRHRARPDRAVHRANARRVGVDGRGTLLALLLATTFTQPRKPDLNPIQP